MWKSVMSEDDRQYYIKFAEEARKEYQAQLIEYRATGSYQPSKRFKPLEHTNIWVRIDSPCALEQEIQSYDTVQFRPRPPELDEAYEERQIISKLKRKLRTQGLMDSRGHLQEGVDFKKMIEEEKRKQKRQKRKEEQIVASKKIKKQKATTIAHMSMKKKRPSSNTKPDPENDSADSRMEDKAQSNESVSNRTSSSTTLAVSVPTPASRGRIKISDREAPESVVNPPPPEEVYRGRPRNWPQGLGIDCKGWIEVIKQRESGRQDKYWHSPGGYFFRTMKELTTFLKLFKDYHGDENKAYKVFREQHVKRHQNTFRWYDEE
jgi:hypothetical protein